VILYIAQDWSGNVYIVDERDCLPPDVTDFHEVFLSEKANHSEDATLTVDIEDYNEIISLKRWVANDTAN
jgi:hypothetical protein